MYYTTNLIRIAKYFLFLPQYFLQIKNHPLKKTIQEVIKLMKQSKCMLGVFLSLILWTETVYGLTPSNNTPKLNSLCLNSAYELDPLPYDKNALEPYLDSDTIIIHHEKIEQAYMDSYISEINRFPELETLEFEEILHNSKILPRSSKEALLKYAGGIYNHNFLWKSISPQGGGHPTANLGEAIETQFESFDNFKAEFENTALDLCGSGWIWVISDNKGNLTIKTTENEDTPLSKKDYPILCLDLWEHAYYLKYQNRKSEYITSFWSLANWEFAENNYLNALKK